MAPLSGGPASRPMSLWPSWPGPPRGRGRHAAGEKAAPQGAQALHAELAQADGVAAQGIDPRNVRRLVRALEVCLTTGQPFSRLQGPSPLFPSTIVGLTMERATLYRRIDERGDGMLEAGLGGGG